AAKVVNQVIPEGNHSFNLPVSQTGNQVFLLAVRMEGKTAWHKLSLQSGFAALSAESDVTTPAKIASGVTDSLVCTAAGYSGGMTHNNGRTIKSYAGTQNFRMYSLDPSWKVCSPPVTFNLDNSAGVARYKELIPEWVATEQNVL